MASSSTARQKIVKYNDLIIASLVIGIIFLIIIPVPPFLLDVFLIFSISIGLLILLMTLFTTETLQFSIFPSLLLITTLFRLSLNVASTRLILGTGQAGKVIEAFGNFVVGGNYVVGFVIFVIITVIQFVVITNGSGRVAEVAARFTLDALPGKQMSIDADLNAGIITDEEAKVRRKTLQRETDFFGAMDGATKFVKGDAIAGIVIAIINVIGGLIIGIVQLGMPITDALQNYTLLTIGDGLVSQIPALLISTATGILVTRVGSEQNFGNDFSRQISTFPMVIALAAAILFVLGLVPAMPNVLFLSMAAILGYSASLLYKDKKAKGVESMKQEELQVIQKQRQPENILTAFKIDPLEIEIGYGLISLTDESQGGDLLERLAAVRKQCANELGVFVRPIRIRDNLQLGTNSYSFKIKAIEITTGEILPNYFLAMDPGGTGQEIKGIPTVEPTFGLPAYWVTGSDKEKVELAGYTVVDSSTVLITHLTEFIKDHASELLGRQEVKELLDIVKEQNPAVIEELIPDLLSVGEIQKVLQHLLKEKVSIRDLGTILESLADAARMSRELDYLIEQVRIALSRRISKMYIDGEGKMSVITLQPKIEQMLLDSLQQTQQGNFPALEPQLTQQLFDAIRSQVELVHMQGIQPIFLTSSRVRLPFRRLIERFMPNLSIISINEVIPSVKVEAIGTVRLSEN